MPFMSGRSRGGSDPAGKCQPGHCWSVVNNVMAVVVMMMMMVVMMMDRMCAGNAWNSDRGKDGEGDQVAH